MPGDGYRSRRQFHSSCKSPGQGLPDTGALRTNGNHASCWKLRIHAGQYRCAMKVELPKPEYKQESPNACVAQVDPEEAIQCLYTNRCHADCAVGQQIALMASQYDLFGKLFNYAFSPRDLFFGSYVSEYHKPVRNTPRMWSTIMLSLSSRETS